MVITLQWDDNSPAELVGAYRVYQTVNGGMQTLVGETTLNSLEVVDPEPGNYVFHVSAVNLAGEGPQSDGVVGPAIPSKVLNVTISVA